MGLRPSHPHESNRERSVRVDDVELISSELPEHAVERRKCQGIALGPRRLDCPEAMRIGIRLAGNGVPRREQVDRMAPVAQIRDQGIDGDTDAV
jgi:hypothetical protein